MRTYLTTIVVALATVVIALGLFFSGYFVRGLVDQRTAAVPVSDETLERLPNPVGQLVVDGVSVDDDPAWGPEQAAVTIIEFSDYQCPFCGRFFEQTYSTLKDVYGEQVRYVFRDFPLTTIHPGAKESAEAAQCAFEQDRFWDYHDLLFENQQAQDKDSLIGYAADLGLEADAFAACLDSGKYANEVQADVDAGLSYGVAGTPTFFVNGRKVVGAQPFGMFQQIIEEELSNSVGR